MQKVGHYCSIWSLESKRHIIKYLQINHLRNAFFITFIVLTDVKESSFLTNYGHVYQEKLLHVLSDNTKQRKIFCFEKQRKDFYGK